MQSAHELTATFLEEDKNKVVVTFDPNNVIGFHSFEHGMIYGIQGFVTDIVQGSHADRLGVGVGWQIVKLQDSDFSSAQLQNLGRGRRCFTITFMAKAEGSLALMLAPRRPLDIGHMESAIWKRIGFPGFSEEDYFDHYQKGDFFYGPSGVMEEGSVLEARKITLSAKVRLLMWAEYVGALGCVAVGYCGYPLMWCYNILRPLWLMATMRAELVSASYGCSAPLFLDNDRFHFGLRDDTLVALRTMTATVCGVNVRMSKATFMVLANMPIMAAPWQSAVVLGDVVNMYFRDHTFAKLWHESWGGIASAIGVIELPLVFAVLTVAAWAISIYHTRNSLAASDKTQGNKDSHLRSSADACNLNVLAEVVHQRFAMDRDKVAYVAGDAIGGYALGEFDLGDIEQYLGGRSKVSIDGKEIPPEHLADLHGDFVAACVKVAQNDRCKRFGTKTLPHAMILYVKANWLMLLLANQSALDSDSAIQETWFAIALSLYTLVLQCYEQWALVQGLRDLHLVLWKVVGRGVNVKNSALKASRTWKKQATILAITALVTLLAVIQTVGARMCRSHVFALTAGCVAAA